MTYPVGGSLVIAYGDGAHDYELVVPVAPFEPTTFLYTGAGFTHPTEAGLADTFINLATLLAPYYDNSWALALRRVLHRSGTDAAPLSTLPATGPVVGTSGLAAASDPAYKRGFTFASALGNMHRLKLYCIAASGLGAARSCTPGAGGFDARDQFLVNYLAGQATGALCWDGLPFPPSARVYMRLLQPQAPVVPGAGGSGGAVGFTGDCLVWPLGARICNPLENVVTLTIGPSGASYSFDETGMTFPNGSRLEVV